MLGVPLREDFSYFSYSNIDMKVEDLKAHPLHPTLESMIELVKANLTEWKCDHIFIATIFKRVLTLLGEYLVIKLYI